jgi:hypothetical protein
MELVRDPEYEEYCYERAADALCSGAFDQVMRVGTEILAEGGVAAFAALLIRLRELAVGFPVHSSGLILPFYRCR